MTRLRIDNFDVEVAPGSSILDAARQAGIRIPTLCHRPGHSPQTSCLVCLVKVNNGARLLPSCATKVADGMVVESESAEVREARKTAIELLLAEHAGDCMAPCQGICPAHMDIPRMLDHIAEGRLREALMVVKEAIALPAVLGRICPELCEKGCRRGEVDQPVAICKLKRHVADDDLASGNPYLPACLPPSGKRVAIIGAGPAGLAAAYYLQALGHNCTILDEHPKPGGALRYAVMQEKLPPDILDAEISVILKLGATFHGNFALARDATIDQLRADYDAVLIAIGPADAARAGALGLPLLGGKSLNFDKHTLMTHLEGVFVAGAVISPYKHAVRAVADGRSAAASIHQFLTGSAVAGPHKLYSVHLGKLKPDELIVSQSLGASITRATADPASGALSHKAAPPEADRCLRCQCSADCSCELRKLADQLGANQRRFSVPRKHYERTIVHPGVVYERGKCISCGLCVQVATEANETLGLTFIGRGFDIRIGVPLNGEGQNALEKCARECVEICPTGALNYAGRVAQRYVSSDAEV
jgi:ferredoxin